MPRSLKKGPFVDKSLIEKVNKILKTGEKKPIRIWSRRSTVIPEFVGLTFEVHNGKTFISIHVTEKMVGHKFGEFALTRIFRGHSGIKSKAKITKK